jgi:hypothetical protein
MRNSNPTAQDQGQQEANYNQYDLESSIESCPKAYIRFLLCHSDSVDPLD